MIGFCQLIVAGIETARLPIAGNVNVRELREKEINFRGKPGPIPARVLPVVACIIGLC